MLLAWWRDIAGVGGSAVRALSIQRRRLNGEVIPEMPPHRMEALTAPTLHYGEIRAQELRKLAS